MHYAFSLLLGYIIGSLSPSALISRLKKKNLRDMGTGNLGATNTALNFGKTAGAVVMLFDITKGAGAVLLAKALFPEVSLLSGLISGSAAVIGHIFPFYMKFKGGKGLAAYGGMVLATDPSIFLFLLCLGLIFILIFDHGIALTLSASILFPALMTLKYNNIPVAAISSAISIILIIRHSDNIMRAKNNREIKVRAFFKSIFGDKDENLAKYNTQKEEKQQKKG